jgi:hypothetical protein
MSELMKILFVEQGDGLQPKWIEPLRKKGWGVVRARSAEDATRMMSFHGDSLDAIAVGERFVGWAEKQDFPFVVLLSTWQETDVIRHQNSEHSAVAYLSFERGMEEIYTLFEANQMDQNLKATGTDGVPVSSTANQGLELEDYSGVLSKPEVTSSGDGKTQILQLKAPKIVLGGESAKPEVEALNFAEHEEVTSQINRTVLIESTSMQIDASGVRDIPALELDIADDFSFEERAPLIVQSQQQPQVAVAPAAQAYSVPVNQFSVNPMPGAQISDLETLRSYLALREQDVAVLSGQVRSSQERIQQLETQIKMEKARSTELTHMVSRQEQQLTHYDQEKKVELDVLGRQIEDMDGQLKDRTEKARLIEAKLRLTIDEVGKVKERVRVDIRRIRVREKELESQLEVLKKDSSALLHARDEKILELKRKLDLLEFNMELVQEQFNKEKQTADELKSRLKDAAQVMKQANGLLEQ